MSTGDAYLALSRFGFGPRPGDLGNTTDWHAAILADIADPARVLLPDGGLAAGRDIYGQIRAFQKAREMAKQDTGDSMAASGADMSSASGQEKGGGSDGMTEVAHVNTAKIKVDGVPSPVDLLNTEVSARAVQVLAVPVGFAERLVAFWANHFAVQAAANEVVRGLAGAFEREAIRPHVLGSFHDMVVAVTQHPAMLMSLNNATSIGPDSPQGKKSGKGLNENHARELMELHTVGVTAGYTQADVTSFAKVLTGWTFGMKEGDPNFGQFAFRQGAHEPGPQTVMGKTYAQRGVEQGLAVIADLVANPATATHIATQLARYFVSDSPDPALVTSLADVFRSSEGDLKAVTTALANAPQAWVPQQSKLRSPQEFLWASLRALGLEVKPQFINRTLADLGEPMWNPPSPQGFEDDAATWLAPDAMTTRIDVAQQLAAQDQSIGDPTEMARALLGDALSSDTQTAIARAESRQQAIALLLMSPEFQRR
jgi:uncharacterized protein (DUF1800 family)